MLDLLSKLTENYILPFNQEVNIIENKASFFLIYNSSSSGSQAKYLLQEQQNINNSLVINCISVIIFIFIILYIRNKKISKLYKFFIYIRVYNGI